MRIYARGLRRTLVEFDRSSRTWQNLVKASDFIRRVFHQDVPTVTKLVPLQKGLISTLLRDKEICNIIIETIDIYLELINIVINILYKELYNL